MYLVNSPNFFGDPTRRQASPVALRPGVRPLVKCLGVRTVPRSVVSAYRKLRLCSNSGGFEAIPDPPLQLDLAAARRTLEGVGVAVVDARVMLVAALDPEVTISRSGRLLFKTRDPAQAERAFQRLRRLLDLPGTVDTERMPRRGGIE